MGSTVPSGGPSLAIFIISIVMMALSIVAVSLRIFVRLHIVRAFGWDDALMLAALVLTVVFDVCCFVGAMNGLGRSRTDFTSFESYRTALLYWWLCQIFYTWSSAIAKISIAVALLRLTINRIHRIILWSIIALTIAVSFMFWMVLLLDCHPISYFWDYANPSKSGTCMSTQSLVKVAYVYSCLTIVCDLTLGLLPIFLVWKLQMNYRTKIAVGGILSMGAIASVAVIVRIPYLHFYADTNFLHSTFQIAIWSVVETGLGITASSLFTLRPLFRWLLDEKLSYGRTSRSAGKGYNKYPLSSLNNDGLRVAQSPGSRPGDENGVINSVTIQPSRDFITANSSEEALYPDTSLASSGNYVTVSRTFVQTISERPK